MYGLKSKIDDKLLYRTVSNLYRRYKRDWENEFKSIDDTINIHFVRNVPYSLIKDTLGKLNMYNGYIETKTDSGNDKKSSTDGGVIYVTIGNSISLPLAWFEVKSSNSCLKKGRGQASGLITEQESRCRAWSSCICNKVKPLVAFMHGYDFDKKFGTYNIDRIKMDLHTEGNKNPYNENNDSCSSWLFYKREFTEEEIEKNALKAIIINKEKLKTVIKTLSFRK